MASSGRELDPKSAWALGEFRESHIELLLVDDKDGFGGRYDGGITTVHGNRGRGQEEGVAAAYVAYQGERLRGRLVVKFDNDDDTPGANVCKYRPRDEGTVGLSTEQVLYSYR